MKLIWLTGTVMAGSLVCGGCLQEPTAKWLRETTMSRDNGPFGASTEYADLRAMRLSAADLAELVGRGGECVFAWTTKAADPMAVMVSYVYRDDKFWTTSVATRARIQALAARPQSAIVLNNGGHSATFKGLPTLHRHGDQDWGDIASWFLPALAGTDCRPNHPIAQQFERSLNTAHQVIVETTAELVVSFDFNKLAGGPH